MIAQSVPAHPPLRRSERLYYLQASPVTYSFDGRPHIAIAAVTIRIAVALQD